jgi:hypothetical protein
MMTWEEFCEKAKEMGYREVYDDGCCFLRTNEGDLFFCKDGTIDCGGWEILEDNRTYEQMLAIMEALR